MHTSQHVSSERLLMRTRGVLPMRPSRPSAICDFLGALKAVQACQKDWRSWEDCCCHRCKA